MKNLVIMAIFALFGATAIAHGPLVANDLEIFSEEGELFTLYVNGQKVNEEPASYVKLENTHHNMVYARIVLEDKHQTTIKREALMIHVPGADAGNEPVASVFMIKKRLSIFKKRRYKLRSTNRSKKKLPLHYVMN